MRESYDAPSSVPPFAPLTPLPRPSKLKGARRPAWATTALLLSAFAIVFEALWHPMASLFFDPLPDLITGVAYATVLFFLWFNEAVLKASAGGLQAGDGEAPRNLLIGYLGRKRAAGLAIAGTGVAILVASMATWMFLPFLPAAPLLVLTGIGALLLVPFLDLWVLIAQMVCLRRLWRDADARADSRVSAGAALLGATAAFFLVVRPALIGQWTAQALEKDNPARQRAFAGLRLLRGEQAMLDLTYRRNPAYWVCLGYNAPTKGLWPWNGYSWSHFDDEETRNARRTFFLLTGTPFESLPRPASATRQGWDGQDDVAVEETGGTVVGRSVPGLSLESSTLRFGVDAKTETAEGTWTLTFRNDTNDPQEARADILLPPGATCHAVSLWINGKEMPAAFGSPQRVRAAYQQIAVVQRRDPLLVTMPAPDHLLAQCFPVPAHKTMKIKLGITAPLTWRRGLQDERAALYFAPPAFGPVNFDVPTSLVHHVTLNGDVDAAPNHNHLRGEEVFAPRSYAVTAASEQVRWPKRGPVGSIAEGYPYDLVRGTGWRSAPLGDSRRPVDLWVLLDASQGMNDLLTRDVQRQIKALALPVGSRVWYASTRLNRKEHDFAPIEWDSPIPPDILPPYVGGSDPAPALTSALHLARTHTDPARPAVVLFLHAASPANVSDLTQVRRELQLSANGKGPALVSIQLAPRAQDAVAMELAGFKGVYARRALPGDPTGITDAIRYATEAANAHNGYEVQSGLYRMPLGGHAPAVNGVTFGPMSSSKPPLPAALERLHQASRTLAGWYEANTVADPEKALDWRIYAGRPAAKARLVTPLSSAVVLETQEDYKKNDLDDKDGEKGYEKGKDKDEAAAEPDVNAPEPATALLLGVGLFALKLMRRRRE